MTHIHFRGLDLDRNKQWKSEGFIKHFLEAKFPDEIPGKEAAMSRCTVSLGGGREIIALAWGDHVFIGTNVCGWNEWGFEWNKTQTPFISVELMGQAETRRSMTEVSAYTQSEIYNRSYWHQSTVEEASDLSYRLYDKDVTRRRYKDAFYVPFAFLPIKVTVGDVSEEGQVVLCQPETGKCQIDPNTGKVRITTRFYGLTSTWEESLKAKHRQNHYDFEFRSGLSCLITHVHNADSGYTPQQWWGAFLKFDNFPRLGMDGLTSVMKQKEIKPVIERLQKEEPSLWTFFEWLVNPKTSDKQKNNALLATCLTKIGSDYDKLVQALKDVQGNPDAYHYTRTYRWGGEHIYYCTDRDDLARQMCLRLPGASEKVAAEEAKADWRKRKDLAGQADGLGISTEEYPLLRKAVENGDIPTSIFHQPNGEPVNVEFPLWEKALNRKGWAEIIFSITQDAARRSTYEKDVSPFLMFLFKIETYLKKHTGKKWTAMPTFVESEWKLEMGDEDDDNANGTVKKRSAFTPVADNETNVITVPFVAVCVSGVRTQWCYSRFYHLFEEGFTDPESGGIVLHDFEEKLNGRDDYGLMFYTLTGTNTARGYPTFLIIFERIRNVAVTGSTRRLDVHATWRTRVHFHRVRPQRTKDGKHTPACKLVEACYQYMAGNIPATDITAQQGDLIFIKHPNDPIAAGAKTEPAREGVRLEFESHAFVPQATGASLALYESTAKTPANRLGFLYSAGQFNVEHPEHQDIVGLNEGWYEVRRAKSWEANPRAIWSLTID